MHYNLPLSPLAPGRFDRTLFQAYLAANKKYADKVMEVISLEDDYVWIHDYHLMVLPTYLRKRFHSIRMGFFLHCPFPSSEVRARWPWHLHPLFCGARLFLLLETGGAGVGESAEQCAV